jgi:hypothetical protein
VNDGAVGIPPMSVMVELHAWTAMVTASMPNATRRGGREERRSVVICVKGSGVSLTRVPESGPDTPAAAIAAGV